ncbi:MAG: hypothetical protein V7K47_12475 [Nostoc sp.]
MTSASDWFVLVTPTARTIPKSKSLRTEYSVYNHQNASSGACYSPSQAFHQKQAKKDDWYPLLYILLAITSSHRSF